MENTFRINHCKLCRTIILVGLWCGFSMLVQAQRPLQRPIKKATLKVHTQPNPQRKVVTLVQPVTQTVLPAEVGDRKLNYEWVDLGLSVRWATCNLGAARHDEFGDYYCWGNTKKSRVCNERWCEHYKNPCNVEIQGDIEYDVARAVMGGKWRLPTEQEFSELLRECTWAWCSLGISSYGYRVIGPNGNSIFLPAQGFYLDRYRLGLQHEGYYWTASSSEKCLAYALFFNKGTQRISICDRSIGRCIRAVLDKK